MSSAKIITEVESSFRGFCEVTSSDQVRTFVGGKKTYCLMDFVQAWIESGVGIRACNGDHHTYLIGLVGIIDEWRQHPSITDYVDLESNRSVQRRASSVFDGELGHNHFAFEQFWFEEQAFMHKYPHMKHPYDL
jgi:hypothetical protein